MSHAKKIIDGDKTPAQKAASDLLLFLDRYSDSETAVLKGVLMGIEAGTIVVGSEFLARKLDGMNNFRQYDNAAGEEFYNAVTNLAATGACTAGQSLDGGRNKGRAQGE